MSLETKKEQYSPLIGREDEYDMILSVIDNRITSVLAVRPNAHHDNNNSLFIFGGCGCGKTSTVLRVLRAISHKTVYWYVEAKRKGNSNTKTRGRKPTKRPREEEEEEEGKEEVDTTDVLSMSNTSKMKEFYKKYNKTIFNPNHNNNGTVVVQGHYVNCADMSATMLCDGIAESIRKTFPTRSNQNNVSNFADYIQQIPLMNSKAAKHKKEEEEESNDSNEKSTKKASQNVYFHVVALDEVEYTGQGKEHVLAELSKLSFQTNPREYGFENHFLILVYISNHKDLVHVPSQLLTFLSFRTYTAAELKQICQRIVHHAVQQYEAEFGRKEGALYNLLQENGTRHQKGSRAVKKLPKIEISSTLMSLMCKKCEQLYSCDVRQLASMTRRVVYTAYKAKLTEVLSNTNAKGRSVAGKRNPSTAEQTLQQVVENYANNNNNSPVDSTRSSATIGSAARLSTDSAQSAARTAPPTFVATLTNSAQHIDPCGEEQALERIHELPEEAIVVLSCILVRAHKQQQQRQMLAKKPVGPLSATYKDVHQLYCHYKSSQYLPIPSKGSFANSICCLVELQVITGPTDHGQSGKKKKHETPREEATLTFKGTSHPETVEQYLRRRGEQDVNGEKKTENRYANLLASLKQMEGIK